MVPYIIAHEDICYPVNQNCCFRRGLEQCAAVVLTCSSYIKSMLRNLLRGGPHSQERQVPPRVYAHAVYRQDIVRLQRIQQPKF
jgi:hypothetical protein